MNTNRIWNYVTKYGTGVFKYRVRYQIWNFVTKYGTGFSNMEFRYQIWNWIFKYGIIIMDSGLLPRLLLLELHDIQNDVFKTGVY